MFSRIIINSIKFCRLELMLEVGIMISCCFMVGRISLIRIYCRFLVYFVIIIIVILWVLDTDFYHPYPHIPT